MDVALDGGTEDPSGPVLLGVQEVLRPQEYRLVAYFRVNQMSQGEQVCQLVPLVQWVHWILNCTTTSCFHYSSGPVLQGSSSKTSWEGKHGRGQSNLKFSKIEGGSSPISRIVLTFAKRSLLTRWSQLDSKALMVFTKLIVRVFLFKSLYCCYGGYIAYYVFQMAINYWPIIGPSFDIMFVVSIHKGCQYWSMKV